MGPLGEFHVWLAGPHSPNHVDYFVCYHYYSFVAASCMHGYPVFPSHRFDWHSGGPLQVLYTGDLLALERMSVKSEPETPGRATVAVSGFLPLQVWSPYLRSHPDADFAGFTRRGLSQGFRIGFDYQHPLRPNQGNFCSVKDGGPVYLQQSSCRTSGGLNESCHTPEPHRDYSQATPAWQVPFNCGPVSTT